MLLPELYGDNSVCRRIVAEQGLSRSMRSANDGTFVGSMFRSFVAVLPTTEAKSMVSGWRQDAVGGREDTEGVFQWRRRSWNGSYDKTYG